MLKTAFSALIRLNYIKVNKNKLNTDDDNNNSSNINSGRINNKIANLSSSIKKMDSREGFFIFKASLAFT